VAQQMINEQAYSAQHIAELTGGRVVERHMTVLGTVSKSLLLFAITVGFAILGWKQAADVIHASSGPSWLLGYMLLIALSFLAISRPQLAPLGGLVYAVLMGWWVGGISHTYEVAYDGIVAQALLATMATVLVCLLLYAFRIVKVTALRARRGRRDARRRRDVHGHVVPEHLREPLRFWTHPSTAGTVISIVICIVAALTCSSTSP
jgi:uncharacterized YccA/Bax inhibitor family protein